MTGEELEALRFRIGAPSQEAMADLLQCDTVGYRRYATGARAIPRYIERMRQHRPLCHCETARAGLRVNRGAEQYGLCAICQVVNKR